MESLQTLGVFAISSVTDLEDIHSFSLILFYDRVSIIPGFPKTMGIIPLVKENTSIEEK